MNEMRVKSMVNSQKMDLYLIKALGIILLYFSVHITRWWLLVIAILLISISE
jgi:hypothetical protein